MHGVKARKIHQISMALWILMSVFCSSSSAQANKIIVGYNEKPPFFFTDNRSASGSVVELARHIFKDAGVSYEFQPMPFNRIMENLKSQRPNFIALGLSKSPEREVFANFSKPFFKDKKPLILIKKVRKDDFLKFKTFELMLSGSDYKFGGKEGNIYPIDSFLKTIGPRDIRVNVEMTSILKMLHSRRVDFIMLYPDELEYLLTKTGLPAQEFEQLDYPDLPNAGYRYLLFSKAIPQQTIDRIDRSIAKMSGQL